MNSRMISWPVPDPVLPETADPVLADAARAATAAFRSARERFDRDELAERTQVGAAGGRTTRLDNLVDTAIAEVVSRHRVNLLSEEIGVIDNGSAMTLVVDPVDGTGNAVAGVPLCAFAAAVCRDGVLTESLTCWLDTGRCWHAIAGVPGPFRTTGRTALDGAAVSLLRPQRADTAAWWRIAGRAERVRILSSSCLEAALVAEGSTDAFADVAGDRHRIVDLAPAMVLVTAAGGAVIDALGRPIEVDNDLSRRWSGVVAASPALAEELAAVIRGS
ncbi:MAG TPA: inositol monophosphatase family protein [Trebonia sp.]